MMRINVGCGDSYLEGYINIDSTSNSEVKPDIICDIKQTNLPFKDQEVEQIMFLHCIEHIEIRFWRKIFEEFFRVLQVNGQLVVAYPEFEICAKYFIENYKGAREYWRATLYGRQLYPGDYHVVPMRTPELIVLLQQYGFSSIKYIPEIKQEFNTILSCNKGIIPNNREDLLRKEIFHL